MSRVARKKAAERSADARVGVRSTVSSASSEGARGAPRARSNKRAASAPAKAARRVTPSQGSATGAGAAARTRSAAATERECARLEELCQALERRAELSELSHRETVSTISHDLRNPLSVILVSSRMLLRALPPDAPARKEIDRIVRAADEINQLAQDLVDATQIESGSLRVGCEPHEVGPIVDKALELVAPSASAKPLEIARELSGSLPSIACDRERLVQAIASLIANAARFTPRGGRITVRAEAWGPGAKFSIADTGPGIPAEQRAGVFARFAEPRRSAGQAIGLGPFVAKGIVEAHGGTIWVESEPGAGTTVSFTIPGAQTAAA